MAYNLASIGFIIAHEIIHGFDKLGCQFDGDGEMHNWWSKEDSDNYKKLQEEYKHYTATHPNPERPKHWHGFKIIPQEFEFWQDGKHRLHLRHKYIFNGTNWQHIFLYP